MMPSATMNASVAKDHRAAIMRAWSLALCALEAALDPGLALHSVGWIDAVRGVVGDVRNGRNALRPIELRDADRRLCHGLMPLRARHVHCRAESLEPQLLE